MAGKPEMVLISAASAVISADAPSCQMKNRDPAEEVPGRDPWSGRKWVGKLDLPGLRRSVLRY